MKRLWAILSILAAFPFLVAPGALFADEVKLGSLLALSGDLGAYGIPINNGASLAKDDMNAAGGVLGKKVAIVTRDTRTNPTVAVDAAKKMVDIDRVLAIAGALSSGVTIPVATSVAVPAGVLQISPASTSAKITTLADNDFLFRTVAMDALQSPALARVVFEMNGFKRAAVVYVNNDYGEGLALGFREAFESLGGTILDMVPYNKDQPSYKGEALKAIRGNPRVVVMLAYPQFGSIIMRQIIELGYTGSFAYGDGMKAPEVAKNVGARYVEGTCGTVAGNPNPELSKWFREHYKESFGRIPPKPYIDTQYDALILMGLALEEAGRLDRAAIRDNLRAVANPPGKKVDARNLRGAFELVRRGEDVDYEGVSGPCDFDEHGDVPGSFEVWKFKGDTIETVTFITVGE